MRHPQTPTPGTNTRSGAAHSAHVLSSPDDLNGYASLILSRAHLPSPFPSKIRTVLSPQTSSNPSFLSLVSLCLRKPWAEKPKSPVAPMHIYGQVLIRFLNLSVCQPPTRSLPAVRLSFILALSLFLSWLLVPPSVPEPFTLICRMSTRTKSTVKSNVSSGTNLKLPYICIRLLLWQGPFRASCLERARARTILLFHC